MDAVAAHSELDFVDDALSSRFNTEHLTCLQDVVRRCLLVVNAGRAHYFTQAVAFNQELVLMFLLLNFANNCSHN